MIKRKSKIIAGVVVVIVLAFVFWYGGDSPSLRGLTTEPEKNEVFTNTEESNLKDTVDKPGKPEASVKSTIEVKVTEKPVSKSEDKKPETTEPITQNQTEGASANPDTKNAPPTTNTPAEKEDTKQTISDTPASSAVTNNNFENTSDLQNNSLNDASFSKQITTTKEAAKEQKIKTEEPSDTEEYLTSPVSDGNPLPTEPGKTFISDKELTCTLSVRCDTILKNITWLDKEKVGLVPEDGIIFAEKQVPFYEGESVFNLLAREMKRNKIHLEFENTPVYNSAYIEGIANLYEFDCGELSGWMYKVNDWFPNYGCSRYQLKSGDRVEWVYTCDLGADVGGKHTQRINNYE